MNTVWFLFLSLSLSGSILALVWLMMRSLLKDRLGNTWQYYIWLIVILRFLVPFTPEASLINEAARYLLVAESTPVAAVASPDTTTGNANIASQVPNIVPETPQATTPAPQTTAEFIFVWRGVLNYVWLFWLPVALILLVHKVTRYRNLIRFVRIEAKIISDVRIQGIWQESQKEAKLRKHLPLCMSKQVPSPMLVGLFRPMVVIPPLNATDEELRGIFRHELTHYKRLDFLYKWLVQITLCLHWFNPFVYFIGKQINHCCELSCDEMVIHRLNQEERLVYGDALIASLETQGCYSDFVVPITMSENADIVKERLDAIMKYKKPTRRVTAMATLPAVLLLIGGCALGGYTGDSRHGTYYHNTTVEFPANSFERTEFNGEIFDVKPFALHMNIPPDWELVVPEQEGDVYSDLWSPVGIYKDGELIGSIGYNTFELYPDAGDNYIAIYNQLMLGSVVNWNTDYTPVIQSDTKNTATCKVARSQIEPGMSNAEAPIVYNQGILAHDNELLVYIGIEVEEGALTEEELDMLVTSIVLKSTSETENNNYAPILSIQFARETSDATHELLFTDELSISRIANLILDKEVLEDTDGIEPFPESEIKVTVQDGPGTNYKLTIYPATVPALEQTVTIIQGELIIFYADLQAYEQIADMIQSESDISNPWELPETKTQ